MILITGATGVFGSAVINTLLQKGTPANQITALTRNATRAQHLKGKGIYVVEGDYDNFVSLTAVFKGIDKLLFVSGSDTEKRLTQHKNVVNAAKAANVKHIMYTSYEGRNETVTSPLWFIIQSHLQTEEWIKVSGLTYTILKNNLYMDFIPAFAGEKVLDTRTIYFPAGNGKVSAALRSEFAEAAANVLSSQDTKTKIYRLTNTEAYSYYDVAAYISEISGKEVNYTSPSTKEFLETFRKAGASEEHVAIFTGFAAAQAKGELDFISGDLEKILGRKPTSLKTYLNTIYNNPHIHID